MLDEGSRFVLCQYVDRRDARVDQVTEHEIDDPVTGGEGQCGFGVLGSQRMKPRSIASRQD